MIIENKKISEAYNQIRENVWQLPREELTEASLAHVLGHQVNGYCIVSACRHDWPEFEMEKFAKAHPEKFEKMSDEEKAIYFDRTKLNKKYTKELANKLRDYGIGYIPVYGGFHEYGDNGKAETKYENSFLLPCYTARHEPIDFEKVKQIAIELGKEYRQQSVLINPPNGKPYYYTTTPYGNNEQEGDEDHNFAKDAKLNDVAQEYFTSLNKVDKYPSSFDDATVKRFSYVYQPNDNINKDESSINECTVVEIERSPQSMMEAHRRFNSGEIVNLRS